MDNYYGTYTIGKATSKEEAGRLLGADNIIGDVYRVITEIEGERHIAKVINRFGNSPVYFNEDISRQLSLLIANSFKTYAILSCVGFTQDGGDGNYWAEFLVISFPSNEIEIYSLYVDEVAKAIKDNRRPEIDLENSEIEEIIKNKGKYVSTKHHPKLEKKKGQMILKSHVKLSDRLIEQGRRKTPGCYIVGWGFLLCIVALIVFLIMKYTNGGM